MACVDDSVSIGPCSHPGIGSRGFPRVVYGLPACLSATNHGRHLYLHPVFLLRTCCALRHTSPAVKRVDPPIPFVAEEVWIAVPFIGSLLGGRHGVGLGSFFLTLVIKCADRVGYQRTRLDRFGFPRGHLARAKAVRGFAIRYLVRAVIRG